MEKYVLVAFLALEFTLAFSFLLKSLMPVTRKAYEKVLSSWTDNRWYVLVALLLYDNLGVKFKVEDEEPWFKKMVIRKDGKVVEEFGIDYNHRTIPEFEDRIAKIANYGMPSIGCPPFATPKELEMKLEVCGTKKNKNLTEDNFLV